MFFDLDTVEFSGSELATLNSDRGAAFTVQQNAVPEKWGEGNKRLRIGTENGDPQLVNCWDMKY